MIALLVGFSLRFRGIVIALAVLLLGYGIYVAAHSKFDVFPDFVPPQVVVQTEAPGLSAEQVETLVTRPLESALNGLGNLDSLRSESIASLSIVTLVFLEGADIFRGRQMVAEKLGELAGQLPQGVKTPKMSPLTSSTMDLLKIGLVSEKLSPMDLRSFANWTLRPVLLAVPGVAKCSLFGGEVRQIQIQVDPDRLMAFDLSIQDVLQAARLSTGVRGAGFVETENQRIILQTLGQSVTAASIGETVLASRNGLSIRLKDVGTVVEAGEPKFGDTLIQGRPGVLLTMSGQYGANTLEVTRRLEVALADLAPVLQKQGIQLYPRLHRPATFIEAALKNLKSSLFLGAILVAVVLFLFLGNLQTAFISLTAIPLSLLAAVIILDRFKITLNTMTLGGLALAIGEVVDDAIIDVENIFRRARQNLREAGPKPLFQTIFNASLEVRSAVVYATFIVALVFVPVLTLSGLQGSFFAPLALAYILAIAASLLVALTVTPALAYLVFDLRWAGSGEPRLQNRLKSAYQKLLRPAAGWPRLVVALVVICTVAALCQAGSFGQKLLPDFREGHFVLQATMAPGTSMPEMLRVGKRISDTLLANPLIATVEQQVGRAEQGEDPWGPHRSEFHVELKPATARQEKEAEEQIRETLEKTPGIASEVLTFLADRVGESLAGETAPVVISIFGEDLNLLDQIAGQISEVLRGVRGTADLQVKSPPGAPRLAIRLRPERLVQFGFRAVDVAEAVQIAYQGAVAAQLYQKNQTVDLAVILDPRWRADPESVGALPLRNGEGLRLPLSQLAEISLTTVAHSILHDGARRRQTVTCNPRGRDVSSFVAEAKQKIRAQVPLPPGVYLEFKGAAEAQRAASRELLVHSAMAAVGILLLLTMVLQSWPNLLLVLLNVPFAFVGGILAIDLFAWFRDHSAPLLTIGSLVGFVTLFGITMRNSIMLISHFEHLIRQENLEWNFETAMRGASERLLPILMTALVTALGLLPLALGAGAAGQEIEGPMAVVILGGLVTSTLLNLLALPVLALHYGAFRQVSREGGLPRPPIN